MLATRISFMNELTNLAEELGADIEQVRLGIGSDPRIGYDFLYAGCGYGGSCFPKDVRALQRTAGQAGLPLRILHAVEQANEAQKQRLTQKITTRLGERLDGRRFALWGLAFKANTDDMREAPSRVLIQELLDRGASLCAYDPVAMSEARRIFSDQPRLSYAAGPLAALDGADALVIVTEWKEFLSPDFAAIKQRLKQPLVFDGRNLRSGIGDGGRAGVLCDRPRQIVTCGSRRCKSDGPPRVDARSTEVGQADAMSYQTVAANHESQVTSHGL
jgi:UDPglucose 6-dehydrogenase